MRSKLLCLATAVALLSGATAFAQDVITTKTVLSPVYKIDKIFRSMEGPASSQAVNLLEGRPRELCWLVGMDVQVVKADGKTPALQEYMCHLNVDLDLGKRREHFVWNKGVSPRAITLSQGQFNVEFPPGFGFPVMSDEPLLLATQVLNHNEAKVDDDVRHKVTYKFIRDRDLQPGQTMRAMFGTSAFGMKRLTEGEDPTKLDMGDGTMLDICNTCLPGQDAPNSGGMSFYEVDGFRYTGHWIVPPGREENRTDVTKQMAVPFDTTLHYAVVHVHPYCESIELIDKTTGQSVFKSMIRNPNNGRVGVEYAEAFTSADGIPVYKDHKYELVSIYNNPLKTNVDSMATIFMYLDDKEFVKPNIATDAVASTSTDQQQQQQTAQPIETFEVNPATESKANPPERIVFRTVAGDMVFRLFTDVAPQTTEQFKKLVAAGAYDSTHFYRVEPGFVVQLATAQDREIPLTGEQSAMIHPLPCEASRIPHGRGILSLARWPDRPSSGETSFSIMLGGAPHLDATYAVFGVLEKGQDVLDALEQAPRASGTSPAMRLSVLKAEVVKTEDVPNLKLAGPQPLAAPATEVPATQPTN